ncbi:flippase [Clostridium perfringens]|nr:flippase [Clostridium perfringens]
MDYSKKKSVSVNAILNVLKTCLSIIFPLITFPYISRVLMPENVGKINFASSINSYFMLFAGLGVSIYAIREGARIRNTKYEIDKFASEVFSINIISTIISYILLFIMLIYFYNLEDYRILILIYSIQIIFTTISVEWIYSIFEDYLYITLRTFFIQVISLILMFLFVKTQSDYIKYVIICVFSASAMNIFNFIHARKYCKIAFTINIDWKKHLFPIIVLFANSIAILIYVESDTTLLGLLCGNYEVGLYSVSVKIYKIVKQAINAIVIVSIPRISYYLAQEEIEKYYNLLNRMLEGIIIICFPIIIILIIYASDVIKIISGISYLEASTSLRILSCAIIFSLVASFIANAVLIPNRKENVVLVATIISALANFILNLILIPLWKQNAAALTTLIAEGITFLICIISFRKKLKRIMISRTLRNSFLSGLCMILFMFVINNMTSYFNSLIRIIICVPSNLIIYCLVLFLLQDKTILMIMKDIKSRLKNN